MYTKRNLNSVLLKSFLFFLSENHSVYTDEHIFYNIIELPKIEDILSLCSVDFHKLNKKLRSYFNSLPLKTDTSFGSKQVRSLYEELFSILIKEKNINYIRADDVLWVMIKKRHTYAHKALLDSGFNEFVFDKIFDVYYYLGTEAISEENFPLYNNYTFQDEYARMKEMNTGFFYKPNTQDLRQENALDIADFLVNLSQKLGEREELEPLVGRKNELNRLIQILLRKQKNNPILVGEPGVGKTVLINGLVEKIHNKEVPKELRGYEVYVLNLSKLISGTKYRGDFEERINKILDDLLFKQKVIVFIDEIHTIIGAGSVSNSSLDVANILKPILTVGKIRFIGATTYNEYKKYFSKDKALMRRFHNIYLKELDFDETYIVLQGIKSRYEDFHSVVYKDEALRAAITFSQKYMKDKFLPDKALDILDEVGAKSRIENGKKEITEFDIKTIVTSMLGFNVFELAGQDKDLLCGLESKIREEVVIKVELIQDIIFNIKLLKSGFRWHPGTLGAFLFAGLVGIGKTTLVNVLSKNLKLNLISLKMSEFRESYSISKIIGPPPGYIGYEEGSKLVDDLLQFPNSILFLSEMNKAHQTVRDIFFQSIKTGVLVDSLNRVASLKEAIVIVSINLDLQELKHIGFYHEVEENNVEGLLEKKFSKGFIDIFGSIFFFKSLNDEEILRIVIKELDSFVNFVRSKNINLYYEKKIIKHIKEKAYNPSCGLGNIKKFIVKELGKLLVDRIIFEDLQGKSVRLYINRDIIQYDVL